MKNQRISTKDRIRECALELFKTNGYDNVTVMQICEAAGVSKRTFYYHFDSKDQIIDGITAYVGSQAKEILSSVAELRSNTEILWSLMSLYIASSEKYGPEIISQTFINVLQGKDKQDFPEDRYLYNTAERIIENAKRAGELGNNSDPSRIAFTLFHALRSVQYTWAAQKCSFNLSEAFRNAFDTVLGICSGKENIE